MLERKKTHRMLIKAKKWNELEQTWKLFTVGHETMNGMVHKNDYIIGQFGMVFNIIETVQSDGIYVKSGDFYFKDEIVKIRCIH
jgi:hypothetical protein